ncbi:MAG: glycosyltransferase family 4 protein [Rhodobacteraceae bacterium]|jgi:glycosyltransferase involved in cell wall biosynthesis|nr:glycosyltransferase family 4 protein [Paracoccaceae bacterium]
MQTECAFAVPGDISAATGGYHYDRNLLAALNAAGRNTRHIALPASFPFPDVADMRTAIDALVQVPPDCALIVDGLAFGALQTDALDRVTAPIVALVHHPLAHESGLPASQAQRLRVLERANLDRAAHVLVPSGHIRDVLCDGFGVAAERITVLRPGKPDFRAPTGAAPDPGAPLILSVGLLHPRKGHDILIAALAACADLAWRAVIVGTPWEPGHDDVLSGQIEAAGLADRIELAGRVAPDRLARLYAEARVFALATRYEGYGIVFDEALVHGLPIVATSAGAVPGTVPTEAGTLVPAEDALAFAHALRPLLRDDAQHARMAQAARRAGQDLPTWADAAETLGHILDRVRGRTP